jgi:hypothetical protein
VAAPAAHDQVGHAVAVDVGGHRSGRGWARSTEGEGCSQGKAEAGAESATDAGRHG